MKSNLLRIIIMLRKQVTTNRKIRRDLDNLEDSHSTSNRLPPSTDLKTKMSDCRMY